DVSFRGLAAERHGAVDPEGDLGRAQVLQVAPEAGWNFGYHGQLPAAHASLTLRRRADRRPFGEITGAREAFEEPAAFRRPVLIERCEIEILDVEGDAIAEREHQNDRADKRERQPYGIAQELHGLAPGIGP